MKREILLALLIMLSLTGCAKNEDPYRVDTVVYIPADPTDAPTEAAIPQETPATEQTEPAPTEQEAPTETEPEATEAVKETTSTKKSSGAKKTTTSNKKTNTSSKKETAAKATEPPAAKPAETQPTATEPPVTKPAPTEPPATEPPAMEPPVTEPPVTEPPATPPPATEPPETEPEPTDPPLYDISGYSVGSLETSMKDAINAYRTEAGLGEMSMSSRLCAIASCRGYEISQVWSHTRPDGRSYNTVLSDYGYGGSARELLVHVSGSGDGQTIVDQWMCVDSYKELLLGSYSTVGIGIYRANGNTYIACLLVG